MNRLSLQIRLLLISLLIGNGTIILNDLKTIANPIQSQKVSHELLIKKTENKNLASKKLELNNKVNYKNNSIKSSSQRLVGGWTKTLVFSSGEKEQATVFFEPGNSWYMIRTEENGDWYIISSGTWKLSNGILYQTTEDGKSHRGSLKFLSNNEYFYKSENSQDKWRKISSNKNLSAKQLLGTWSIIAMKRRSGHLMINFSERSVLKLIELNANGTFRYKSTDATFPSLGIEIIRRSGTWEYINAGYADGFLLLKNSQGKLLSVSSVNWSSKGGFLNIHRSQYNKNKNQYSTGKIEKFEPTKLRIN